MERLTFEGNFCDIALCAETPGGSFCESGSCTQRKVWERLKAYEETGLTPEEVKRMKNNCGQLDEIRYSLYEANRAMVKELTKWKKAESQGMVAVLPMDKNIGDSIKNARKSAGLTQAALAKELGINRATISKYEKGMIEPSISQLNKIAKILNMSF